MADWKTHINYNYNPAYLAYMFQAGQNAGNLCESEGTDSSSSSGGGGGSTNFGVTQTCYTSAAETQEDSPPHTPEQHVPTGRYHYQGSGLLYIGAAQTDRFVQAAESKRAASDSTSDSETYASPGRPSQQTNQSMLFVDNIWF